jgi:hypothetical protein
LVIIFSISLQQSIYKIIDNALFWNVPTFNV